MALAGDPVQPLRVAFVNENTTYGSTDNAWILFSYTGSTATEFVGEVLGSGPNSGPITFSAGAGASAGSYFSQSYQINDLAAGIEITATPSTRIYVSLGQELDAEAAVATPGNPFSFFGSPSTTATADPNWNRRRHWGQVLPRGDTCQQLTRRCREASRRNWWKTSFSGD